MWCLFVFPAPERPLTTAIWPATLMPRPRSARSSPSAMASCSGLRPYAEDTVAEIGQFRPGDVVERDAVHCAGWRGPRIALGLGANLACLERRGYVREVRL